MHVFVDESGDAGFKFDKGSSRHFIVCMLLVQEVAMLEREVNLFRMRHGLTAADELKFMTARTELRRNFFRAMTDVDFSVHASIIDKTALPLPDQRLRQTFHRDQVIAALRLDGVVDTGATIVIDEFGQGNRTRQQHITDIRQQLRERGLARTKAITMGSARQFPLLQVADMYAGIIAAAENRTIRGAYFSLAEARIRSILRIP